MSAMPPGQPGPHDAGRRKCAAQGCPKTAAVRRMRAGPDGRLYGSGCHRRLFPDLYHQPRTPAAPRIRGGRERQMILPQLPLPYDPPKEHLPMSQPAQAAPLTTARRFVVQRDQDPTGVSSTGVVLDGVLWPDGTVSVRWRGDDPSFVSWPSIEAAERKHCYGGMSRIVWIDEPAEADQ